MGLGSVGLPAIVKTAAFGYDGKGQHRITAIEQAEPVWALIGHQEGIVEQMVDFASEISVVTARGLDGAIVDYGAIENQHANHILDLSVAPARVPAAVAAEASAWRSVSSRSWATSACSASSSSSRAMAGCW